MENKTAFRMMISFTQNIKRFFLFSILAAAAASLVGFLGPLVIGFTVDSVIGDKAPSLPNYIMRLFESLSKLGFFGSDLMVCAILIAVFALVAGFFNYLSRVNMAKGSERMINNLRNKLFEHTQSLPFEWHTKNLTGDIIQRCTSDVETVRRFVFQQLIEVLRTVILVAIALVIMFSLNLVMATVVTVFLLAVLIYTIYFLKQIAEKFLLCDEAEGELMVRVQENLTGVRVVRAFGRERFETGRFDEKNIAYTNKWTSLGGTLGLFWAIGDTVSSLQLLCVLIVGSFLTVKGEFTFGDLLVFISYTQILIWPVRQLGRVLAEMSKTGVSLKRIKEILDTPGEIDAPGALSPPMDRDIEFKNVSFTYDSAPVLHNVSFKIKSGTSFGILGATGSGKSTITYLLNRLYDLSDNGGSITIGGVDISHIKKSYLRRNIGLVLQEPFLFSKTIFENIDIASRGRDIEKVREKSRIAAADEDIMSFTKGYDTTVGERGVTLSGGQKQRVAIARTLMMDAPVLVFDDSMSSLDMETDAKIREALRVNTAGATVILISHRISTLMNADMIMVLDGGRISEIGTHGDLVRKNGAYRRVYDLQSGYMSAL
jgi:ATP-binding cassette subfamily B protein